MLQKQKRFIENAMGDDKHGIFSHGIELSASLVI
jgi:hypothetical protein